MKALTILLPFAQLIAVGAKWIETRSWGTKYRGPLAIHAGKTLKREYLNLAKNEPFYTPLHDNRKFRCMRDQDTGIWYPPPGCIIAVAELVDCVKVHGSMKCSLGGKIVFHSATLENGNRVHEPELSFGDYSGPHRYAWILSNVRRVDPISVVGHQGLWNWDPPEQIDNCPSE